MNTKKKALKWLLILVCVLLACMFFARTLQTITTAKIQKISATRGKLEDKIAVKGEIRFSQGEPFTIEDARSLNIIVDKVMARPGYLIKPGDTLFTAYAPEFDSELAKIRVDYEKKVRELTVEVAGHLRITQESEHNRTYNQVLSTTDTYYNKLFLAQAAALAADYTLPEDIAAWGSDKQEAGASDAPAQAQTPEPTAEAATPAPTAQPTAAPAAGEASASPAPTATPDPEVVRKEKLMADLKQAMQEAYDAKVAMDAATDALRRIYMGTSPVRRTGDGVFDYIKKTDGFREEIAKLSRQMLELEEKKIALQNIRAPREGWLTEFTLKTGDKYDGSKPAYTLSKPGETPVFRCDITDVKKPITKGMKAVMEGSDRELTITEVQVASDGKKYAIIELDQETLSALGGLSKLMAQPQNLTIVYRASRTTTLIPASALRSGGDNKHYVFVVQQSWGGMLSNTTYTVKKQDVTVLETSAKLVSLEDDLSYVEIADREDRTLSDGRAVMEYVD